MVAAVPVTHAFAQGAPTKSGAQPAATTKATAQPAATAPATTAAPITTTAPGPATPPPHEIATEVDAAMNEKAQALYKEGNAHYRAGKFAQAQASYTAAWALDLRSQKIVNNLGMTELELKLYRDAAEHLTIALRLADPNDPKRTNITRNLAEARAKVGAIQLKVQAAGQPLDGVEIVDMESGKSYTTPLADPIFVDPKKVSFRIRREGYESQEKVFDLKPGEETTAEITLERPPGYVPGPSTTTTGPTGTTPAARNKLPGFIVGGVGVAALIAGGALVGVAAGQQSSIVNDAPKDANGPKCNRSPVTSEDAQCADLRSRAESTNTLGNAGIGVLVGGGVLVAAAAVYLLIPAGKTPANSKTSQLVPVVGQNGGGLVLSGSF